MLIITTIILFYIVISTILSINNMRDRYSVIGVKISAMNPKEAFKDGFTTLPFLALIGAIVLGAMCLMMLIVIEVIRGILWLLENMP